MTHPLELYLTLGVSFIASGFSGQPRPLAQLIRQGMEHPGFSIVHVQSPCTAYNDTFLELKGDLKNGIQPTLWDIPEDHDTSDRDAAHALLQRGGVPVGVVYHDTDRPSLDHSIEETWEKAQPKNIEKLMGAFEF